MLLSRSRLALILLIVSLLIIAGVWVFQLAGYAPCPLCLQQRWPWYAAIVLTGVLVWLKGESRVLFGVVALLMIGSAGFGAFHAGVEWGWWPGPQTCGGDLSGGLPQLTDAPVVRCDEAALRILGLSLAGWNVLASLGMAAVAIAGTRGR